MNAKQLVGRDAQLSAARTALERVGSGAHLGFEGEPGIGKSALLRAIADLGAENGFAVGRAQGHALERDFPFGVARQVFEPILAGLPPGTRRALLSGTVAPAARLVWGGADAEPPVGDEHAVHHGLYWLTARLAERSPILVVVDDLQWADASSLRWLSYLVRRSDKTPVVVVTARSGESSRLIDEVTVGFRHLRLPPLSAAAVAELTGDAAFAADCHRVTGGNPFLVSAVLSERAGRPLTGFGSRGVARWALSRMRRAAPGAEELARAVALLGDRAEVHVAAELAGLDSVTATAAVDVLLRLNFLRADRAGGGLGFVHSIVRNAIDRQITAGERLTGHTRAARLLHDSGGAPERIAVHLLAADPVGEEWAARSLRVAAEKALGDGAVEVALAMLRRALREPGDRTALLTELGRVELGVDLTEATAHLTEAFETTADPGPAAGLLATAHFEGDRGDQALAVLDRAIPRTRDPADLEILAVNIVARLPSMPIEERLARLRPIAGHHPGAARTIAGAVAYRLSAAGRSREETIEQARTVLDLGPPRTMADCYAFHNAGLALCRAGEAADVARCAEALLSQADAAHRPAFASNGHALRALVALTAGRLGDVVEEARAAIDVDATITGRRAGHVTEVYLAEALLDMGRLEEARQVLTSLGLLGTGPLPSWSVFGLHSRARYQRLVGDLKAALADHLEAGRRLREFGVDGPGTVGWRSQAALVHHRLGNRDAARTLAEEELELARAWGARTPLGVASRTLGLVTGDLGLLKEAVAILAESGSRLEYARALFDLGRSDSDGRELLRTAYAVAYDCGSGPLIEDVAAALNRLGARRPRPRRSGLTAQERRVAEMAADGATNRRIAEELFLTQRTVETHLTSAYRKLGIAGRRQLPDALQDGADEP